MGRGNLADMSSLENLSHENRTFPPSQAFTAQANAQSSLYQEAADDRLAFWERQANHLHWEKKWDQVLEWEVPDAKWFLGGKINASYNCLDIHIQEGRGRSRRLLLRGRTRRYPNHHLRPDVP